MSNDIVKRLRKASVYEAGSAELSNLGDEAADEIDRLRAALEGLNEDGCYACCRHYGIPEGQHSPACDSVRAALGEKVK
jgi:hypothetical protein